MLGARKQQIEVDLTGTIWIKFHPGETTAKIYTCLISFKGDRTLLLISFLGIYRNVHFSWCLIMIDTTLNQLPTNVLYTIL